MKPQKSENNPASSKLCNDLSIVIRDLPDSKTYVGLVLAEQTGERIKRSTIKSHPAVDPCEVETGVRDAVLVVL